MILSFKNLEDRTSHMTQKVLVSDFCKFLAKIKIWGPNRKNCADGPRDSTMNSAQQVCNI